MAYFFANGCVLKPLGTMVTMNAAFEGLDEFQLAATESLDGPLLVIAGPGSGKTRMLTHRIAALAESGVSPASILAVTFTNKAAGEMRERVGDLFSRLDISGAKSMWLCTFHSACVRILRSHAPVVGRRANFSIADSDDSKRILRGLLAGHVLDPDGAARELREQISLAKNKMLKPDALYGPSWHPHLAHWWGEYQRALLEQNLLDFDDLLTVTLEVLRKEPVAAGYQGRFTHILVDEFQDTNACQYEILKILGAHGNVCVVGDADQSIYSWRGAAPSMMQRFVSDWKKVKVVALERNYRSTPEIVEFCTELIASVPAQHRAVQQASRESGVPVRSLEFGGDRDEASWVADAIARSPYPLAQHAVIYRTRAQSRVFEQVLVQRAIPYQVVGDVSFYQGAEVKDALSYMRAAANPFDRQNLARAAAVPRRGLGEKTLVKWFDMAAAEKMDPVAWFMLHPDVLPLRARKALSSFIEDLLAVREGYEQGPVSCLETVFKIPGFMEAAISKHTNPNERKENLEELVTAAQSVMGGNSVTHTPDELGSMSGEEISLVFLEDASLLASSSSEDVEACQLLTAHASKGREFDVVFAVGVERDLFPHVSCTTPEQKDEERRLLFVATSRARRELYVSHCQTRFRFKDLQSTEPSPFLKTVEHLMVPATTARNHTFPPTRKTFGHTRTKTLQPTQPPIHPPGNLAQSPRVTAKELEVGVLVKHDLYGEGVVESFDMEVVHVKFNSGVRTLMLAYAPLTLV